jgi:glyoxylase-like metal-dependent hydrolase (beta-lactamase superfamily II)
MNVKKVGSGYFFSFKDPYKTNVYVIDKPKHLYILDTFLGPESMKLVFKELEELGVSKKEIVVFNSHFDYDHVWGNCFFKNPIILSHSKCRNILLEKGDEFLEQYKQHQKGDVELVLPNMTFKKEVKFYDDNLIFFYSPGHTEDSASCFDYENEILFVGDNLEDPFPYVRILDVDAYIKTLKKYMEYEPVKILSGHDEVYDDISVIKNTIEYLQKFKSLNVDFSKFTQSEKYSHYTNLKTYGTLLEEKKEVQKALSFYKEAINILSSLPEINQQINNEKKNLNDMVRKLKS